MMRIFEVWSQLYLFWKYLWVVLQWGTETWGCHWRALGESSPLGRAFPFQAATSETPLLLFLHPWDEDIVLQALSPRLYFEFVEGIPADYAAVFVFSVKDIPRVYVFFSKRSAGNLMSVFSSSCHPPGSCVRMHVAARLMSEHGAGCFLPSALQLVSTKHICTSSWWETPWCSCQRSSTQPRVTQQSKSELPPPAGTSTTFGGWELCKEGLQRQGTQRHLRSIKPSSCW